MRQLTLSGLLFCAFFLRFHLLGNQELRGDEGFTWNYAQKSPLEIVTTIIQEGDPQPPLHYWLQWGWLQLTGDSEFAMRAWSAFLSLLLIPLIYQVGRKLWRDEVGLIAAGLTAIQPQQIWLAQDVRNMYPLALIFLLMATLALIKFSQTRNTFETLQVWPPWLLYILCGTLAMYSHYYSLFFLIAQGAYLVSGDPRSRTTRLGLWIAAGLLIAALVAPWAFTILPVYLGEQLNDPGSLSFTLYTLSSFGDLLAGPAQTDTVKLTFILAFALLTVIALVSNPHTNPHSPTSPLPYLLAAILVPSLGIYAVTSTRATFNTFYFTFAFPAAYLLIAGAIYFIFQKFKPLGLAILLLGLSGYSLGLYNHYYNPAYTKTRGFREVAAYLRQHAQPDDIYVANAPDPVQVYYLHNVAVNYRMQPGQMGLPPAQINLELDPLITQRVWFVPANTSLDPTQYVAQRLNQIALLAQDLTLDRTNLKLFLPATAAQPRTAQFDDGIRLVGYHYTPNRLTLVWTADSQPSANYTIFVHALATDTYNLNGHDSPPYLPTTQWQPGQLIVNVHEFAVPTDQPVTLVAGLYQPDTGDRLHLQTDSWGEPDSAKVITLTP